MAAKEKTGNAFVETIKTIFWALLIAGVFRTLFFQPFWIPSGSMKETLLIGDFLFVNKMAYGYSYASCPSLMLPGNQIDPFRALLAHRLDVDANRSVSSELGIQSIPTIILFNNGQVVRTVPDFQSIRPLDIAGPEGVATLIPRDFNHPPMTGFSVARGHSISYRPGAEVRLTYHRTNDTEESTILRH